MSIEIGEGRVREAIENEGRLIGGNADRERWTEEAMEGREGWKGP